MFGRRFAGSAFALLVVFGGLIESPAATAGTVVPLGHVIGRLEATGGAAPGAPRGIAGEIVLTQLTTGGTFRYPTNKNGSFDVPAPPGSYRVTGFSPKILANGKEAECRAARRITVKRQHNGSSARTGVLVICSLK